jgi:hypothetical protein
VDHEPLAGPVVGALQPDGGLGLFLALVALPVALVGLEQVGVGGKEALLRHLGGGLLAHFGGGLLGSVGGGVIGDVHGGLSLGRVDFPGLGRVGQIEVAVALGLVKGV